jgi:GNAT superfamily N-acetyltransferase
VTSELRPRRPDDVAPLLVLLQHTHEQQGYPVRSAAVSSWWLAAEEELAAWVALDGERVVGHVALHPAAGAALPLWQSATGRPPARLAVVSRFFTDRTVPGTGSLLLAHAVEQARELGREPVLEVDPDSPAVGFYLRRGWRQVGTVVEQWGHRTLDAVVMVAATE